jgi:ATP-dependent 26S proteasome regulatory subunit
MASSDEKPLAKLIVDWQSIRPVGEPIRKLVSIKPVNLMDDYSRLLDKGKKYLIKELGMANNNGNGTEAKEPRKVDFVYGGDKFNIPDGMDLDEAAEAINRQREEEGVDVAINEPIDAFPLDGAVALMRVLQRRYGWTHLEPTPGFFGPRPPVMVGVEIGGGKRVQVPWGNMRVPKIDGNISTGYRFNEGMPCFLISGNVKRKHERTVSAIAEEVREEIKRASIYKAKAVKINFRDNDGDRKDFDYNLCPKFMNVEEMGDTEPIFSKVIEDAIRINMHNPVRFSKRCRAKGASLKKGILLAGPYGTGKTLTAFEAAKLCERHGWTFMLLEDVRDLDLAIGFAKLYQPCMLFAEDVDRAAAGPRSPEMDRLLNTLDGVESKSRDESLIVVLTTNHAEQINRAFIRPGRIDVVINITPPDEEACLRIVKKYVADGGCKMEGGDEQFKEAIKCLVGANAAFFRCTVEQAKLAAIENMDSENSDVIIRPADLKTVAEGMVPHCKMINPEHGQKNLLEMDDVEVHDPIKFAMEALMHKAAETVLELVADPKTLHKIVVKKMNKRGPLGGSGGLN